MPVSAVKQFEQEFYRFIDEKYPAVPHQIRESKDLDAKVEAELAAAVKEFKAAFVAKNNIKLTAI